MARGPWRTLAVGACGALACGLLGGAALRPELNLDRMIGPQVLMPGGGPRDGGGQATLVARGPGPVPDYVIGTDWVRPHAAPASEPTQPSDFEADRADAVVFVSHDALEPPPAADRPEEEPLPPAAYPSERGGVPYEANLPQPPAPPADEEWTEVDVDRG